MKNIFNRLLAIFILLVSALACSPEATQVKNETKQQHRKLLPKPVDPKMAKTKQVIEYWNALEEHHESILAYAQRRQNIDQQELAAYCMPKVQQFYAEKQYQRVHFWLGCLVGLNYKPAIPLMVEILHNVESGRIVRTFILNGFAEMRAYETLPVIREYVLDKNNFIAGEAANSCTTLLDKGCLPYLEKRLERFPGNKTLIQRIERIKAAP